MSITEFRQQTTAMPHVQRAIDRVRLAVRTKSNRLCVGHVQSITKQCDSEQRGAIQPEEQGTARKGERREKRRQNDDRSRARGEDAATLRLLEPFSNVLLQLCPFLARIVNRLIEHHLERSWVDAHARSAGNVSFVLHVAVAPTEVAVATPFSLVLETQPFLLHRMQLEEGGPWREEEGVREGLQ